MTTAPPATQIEPPAKPWHAVSPADAAQALDVDPRAGLASDEAGRRLAAYGANDLPATAGPGWPRRLAGQFTQFLVVLLVVAAGVSIAVGERLDAAVILGIVALNGMLGFVQEYRAERALRSLRSMTAPMATVRRDGAPARIPARDAVPGDVLLLAAGDGVPADGRLVGAASLRLDEAVLTGESLPVDKSVEPAPADAALGDRASMVYQGALVVHGRGEALVVATGAATEMGRIARSMAAEAAPRTPLQRRLGELGRELVYAAVALSAAVFAVGLLRGMAAHDVFLTAVSLAVAAVPEGLPAASTIVLALGVQRMARRNAIIRRLSAVETLGSVTVVCVDKTGTLTENRMTAEELWLDGALLRADELAPERDGPLREAMLVAAICNDAAPSPDGAGWIGDPTETALLALASRLLPDAEAQAAATRERELPFEARRARMTVVVRAPGGLVAYTKGAPEAVVPASSSLRTHEGSAPLDARRRDEILAVAASMASRGQRVLALALRPLDAGAPDADAERDLTLAALVGLADPLRPGAGASIERARTAGIRPVMLTGDHPVTARAIAARLGLATEPVLVGRDVEDLPSDALAQAVASTDVFARISSEHKLRIIDAFRRLGHIVAMTGDGVNDAPALHAADIGIAMGQGGTDVARDASDMVLADNDFASITAAVEEGRTIFGNIRKFVHYLLSCNLAEIAVVFLLLAGGGATPLTPLHILFVNLLTDGLPALALGVEPPEPEFMRRAPRAARAGILTPASLVPLLGVGALIAGPTLGAYAWGRAEGGAELASRLTFATLVGTQLAAAFAFRSEARPIAALRGNPWLLLAVAASVAALVAVFYLPPLQPAFDTEGLSAAQWTGVLALSLAPLAAVEALKLAGVGARTARLGGWDDAPGAPRTPQS